MVIWAALRRGTALFVALFFLGTSRAEVPRYKLAVGQELVYRTVDLPREWDNGHGGRDSSHLLIEWTIHVLGKSEPGGWRLAFRQRHVLGWIRSGKSESEDWSNAGAFELTPDGALVENWTIRHEADPTVLFPKLPADGAQQERSWEATVWHDESTRTFRAIERTSADEDRWSFAEEVRSPGDVVRREAKRRRYEFDVRRGLVSKVVTTTTQPAQAGQPVPTTIETIELAEVRTLAADELRALERESAAYLAGYRAFDDARELAWADFAHAAEHLEKADGLLASLEAKITLPLFRQVVKSDRRIYDDRWRAAALSGAQLLCGRIGQPSADWQTTDIEGKRQALADYRGRVVVLDFWSRGCVPCLMAMPKLEQLAADYRDRPVAFLGIASLGEDEERDIVKRFKITHPTLRDKLEEGESIRALYGVTSFPSYIIVDGQGIVRHIQVTVPEDLRGELARHIDAALGERQE